MGDNEGDVTNGPDVGGPARRDGGACVVASSASGCVTREHTCSASVTLCHDVDVFGEAVIMGCLIHANVVLSLLLEEDT